MERRIIILSDNRTDTPLLGTEHGLSAYMEYGGRRYLLDTGASDLFMLNAEKLGVDLGEVDYCLISHGHNDHIGGLSAFLEMNHKAKVILSSEIPGAEYASVRRYLHSITRRCGFSETWRSVCFHQRGFLCGWYSCLFSSGSSSCTTFGR